jgi:hypothetical protein
MTVGLMDLHGVIPILKNAEHQVITVQPVEHSLADDLDVQRRCKQHSCVPQHPHLLARLQVPGLLL